ncbi:MAG: hypothetical protein ACRDGU_02490 [Actinomycetota bacterium]
MSRRSEARRFIRFAAAFVLAAGAYFGAGTAFFYALGGVGTF